MKNDTLRIGASWYPEMWPQTEWARDIARMRELGFNVVRLFEFAWHRFEPREGQYDFDWAQKLLDMLHKAGIAVMIGTPTAAPPAWLTAAYPDVLQVRADGRAKTHGMRKHGSHVSRTYREHSARIVSAMSRAIGKHPAVYAWQIDNEMGGTDYSDESHARFHAWLRERYGSIEKLNETWGLEFWSQAYDSFEQIPMPTASVGSVEVPERHHPSLIMAVARFNSDMWSQFIKLQCDIIRQYSDKPITSNMVKGLGMHWYQHNRLFDRVGHSLYADLAHYDTQVLFFDRMRAEKPEPYWLLETAPNWSGGGRLWNIHHDAAGMRNIAWHSTLLGGSMVLFWQWRQHWAGQEMQHGTHVTATGRWRPNKEAWTQVAGEFATQSEFLLSHPPRTGDVGLMLSNEAAWYYSIDPLDAGNVYAKRLISDYHLPLMRAHIWRDVIGPDADLSKYRVLLLPMLPILPAQVRKCLADWVRDGGRLLLGPNTGVRTDEATMFTEQEFGGLESLIGATSATCFTPMWVEDRVEVVFTDGRRSRTSLWCEGYELTSGRPLASYESPGGYGDGHVAAVDHRMGEGRVITLGCPVDPAVYVSLVRELMQEAGLAPIAQGDGDVLVIPRSKPDATDVAAWGLVNLAEAPRQVMLPTGGRDLLSGETVPAMVAMDPMAVRLVVPG